MKYSEAKFAITPYSEEASDLLAALIAEAGFESFDTVNGQLLAYVQTSLLDEPKLKDIISDFPMTDVAINYTISDVEDQNWNETWEKEGFDPIIIGDECIIYDAKKPVDTTAYPLHVAIEAQQAFGTGTHQSTQMIVERLLHSSLQGKRLLDCGCGTGILSIVASKCGASDIVGYDIDEWSVRNTIHNAEINNVDNITVLEGNCSVLSHVSGFFDVVVANINRNVLMTDIPHFADVMTPRAHLILSGFYAEDAPVLIELAKQYNLAELCSKVIDNWMCLEFVKQ